MLNYLDHDTNLIHELKVKALAPFNVLNSLASDSIMDAPSVHAVNEALKSGAFSKVYAETSTSSTTRTISIDDVTSYQDIINKPLFILSKAQGTISATLKINNLQALPIKSPSSSSDNLTSTLKDYWVNTNQVYVVLYDNTSESFNLLYINNLDLATNNETILGTNTTKPITPANLTAYMNEQNIVHSSDASITDAKAVTQAQYDQMKEAGTLNDSTLYKILDQQLTITESLPVGGTMLWPLPLDSLPSNFLNCSGQTLLISEYPELFNRIGTIYGGNGTTTFMLPDFQGYFPVGVDSTQTEFNTLGKKSGNKTITLTTAQLPEHYHTIAEHYHTVPEHTHTIPSHKHTVGAHAHGIPNHTHSYGSLYTEGAGAHSHAAGSKEAGKYTASGTWTMLRPYGWDSNGDQWVSSVGDHSHNVRGSTGGWSGSTNNSTEFDSGAWSGNTGNSEEIDTDSKALSTNIVGAGESINITPPAFSTYLVMKVLEDSSSANLRNLDDELLRLKNPCLLTLTPNQSGSTFISEHNEWYASGIDSSQFMNVPSSYYVKDGNIKVLHNSTLMSASGTYIFNRLGWTGKLYLQLRNGSTVLWSEYLDITSDMPDRVYLTIPEVLFSVTKNDVLGLYDKFTDTSMTSSTDYMILSETSRLSFKTLN